MTLAVLQFFTANINLITCSDAVAMMVNHDMHVKFTIVLCFLMLCICQSKGQGCTTLGQTPATAFPLCTKDTFIQTTVPICVNRGLVVPGCDRSTGDYADKNPYWYRFTCYQSGKLGFSVTPTDPGDDYDWQLYDITNVTDLNSVYTSSSLFVVGNWSGSSGTTGASAKGTSVVSCASIPSDNVNTFSAMPTLQLSHTYLLLISHYSNSQSGYKLAFGGGDAVINDPVSPDLKKVVPRCDAATLSLSLTTRVKCNSLAENGSDFSISPAGATVIGATGSNCSGNFDMDSVTLVLSNPLPPGSYSLNIKKGADANTLLDDCDRDIPAGHQVPFTIAPLAPTIPDSIRPLSCAPLSLQLVFPKNIRCSSIAADGSDFIITGPASVTVKSATAQCKNNFSNTILLTLASPVVTGVVYQVQMVTGSDGNTIFDECGLQTPEGTSISFSVKDTVSADFNYSLLPGCKSDTVLFSHNGANAVNQWAWIFDAAGGSNLQSKQVVFNVFGKKQVTLKVSNGFCADSITKTIVLDNTLKALFETSEFLCPEDAATFKNNSVGKIIGYNWYFGDGSTSTLQTPLAKNYQKAGVEKTYTIQLVAENDLHCFDTASIPIKVFKTCYIAVPNAFTPNRDGVNDYLYPLNAFKADNLVFNVYNRLGQLVFRGADWTQRWDGTVKGTPQSSGGYVWTLQYTEHDTGKKISLKGTSLLIR